MSASILVVPRPRRHHGRMLALAVAPVLLPVAWLLARPSGIGPTIIVLVAGALGAAVIGTFAPIDGRPLLGCTRCGVMAGLSVPAGAMLLASGRSDPSSLGLAVVVLGFGLVQRLRDPASCPRP
jgi:hypothetical protein